MDISNIQNGEIYKTINGREIYVVSIDRISDVIQAAYIDEIEFMDNNNPATQGPVIEGLLIGNVYYGNVEQFNLDEIQQKVEPTHNIKKNDLVRLDMNELVFASIDDDIIFSSIGDETIKRTKLYSVSGTEGNNIRITGLPYLFPCFMVKKMDVGSGETIGVSVKKIKRDDGKISLTFTVDERLRKMLKRCSIKSTTESKLALSSGNYVKYTRYKIYRVVHNNLNGYDMFLFHRDIIDKGEAVFLVDNGMDVLNMFRTNFTKDKILSIISTLNEVDKMLDNRR